MQPVRSSAGFKALLERRGQERDSLIDEARRFAERVRGSIPDARVFLYGSVARGDFNLGSDIDLLIVSDELPPEPLARAAFLYQFVSGSEEPKGLSAQEFARQEAAAKLWHLDQAIEI
jgi:hypothetical protein